MPSVVIVHLRTVPDFCLDRKTFHEAELKAVAAVLSVEPAKNNVLEEVFGKTQNVTIPWHQGPDVRLLREGLKLVQKNNGLRSLSVGDVLELEGELFIVAPCGFNALEDLGNGLFRMNEES